LLSFFFLSFLQVSSVYGGVAEKKKTRVFERAMMRRSVFAPVTDFTADDIEVAGVLLMLHLPRVFPKVESPCGFLLGN
jgi:hypothetical protein